MKAPVRILLVEDDCGDVALVREVLSRTTLDYELDVASDGVEALKSLKNSKKEQPDFLILDLNLPKKSGREILSELKSSPSLRSIPVLVFTSSLSRDDLVKSYSAGANSFFSKPKDLSEIQRSASAIESFWQTAKDFPLSVQFIRQSA